MTRNHLHRLRSLLRPQCIEQILHRVSGTTPATKYLRRCTRLSTHGSDRCWQHQPPAEGLEHGPHCLCGDCTDR